MLDSALILLAAAVSWLFGYRVGKWRGEMDEYIHTAECSLAAARQASRRTPEQIPDVSMMNFPYHSEATSRVRWRRAGAWIVCCGEALPRLQGPRVPLLRPISRPHVPAGAGHGHGHHDSGVSPNASAAANARHSDQHDNSGGRSWMTIGRARRSPFHRIGAA
jgi:hypothetical protein